MAASPSRASDNAGVLRALFFVIATITAGAVLFVVAMVGVKTQLDRQTETVRRLEEETQALRTDVNDLRAALTQSEQAIATATRLPSRVDKLEVPPCPNFFVRSRPPGAPNDDQPAAPKEINLRQWNTLAEVARQLRTSACIYDVRRDDEPDAAYQLEVVLRLGDDRTVEIDMHPDGRIDEAELKVALRALPPHIQQSARDSGCRPVKKAELSVRDAVGPAAIARLLDWWQPSRSRGYPTAIRSDLIVEFDCGTSFWDLELRPDGTVARSSPAAQRR